MTGALMTNDPSAPEDEASEACGLSVAAQRHDDAGQRLAGRSD